MESLSPELRTLVIQIANKNSITNFNLDVNKLVSKEGDGYIGILKGLSVIDKDSEKKLHLVVKKAPTNENLRKQFPTRILFLREIFMYEEIFPVLFKFQDEHNIPHPFKSITKLHGYIDDECKETLLLENLKEDGYTLCNRQEPLNSEHLGLVLTEYAKLHALSFAMKKLEPEKFEKIKKIGGNVMMENMPPKSEAGPDAKEKAAAQMAGQLFASTLEAIKNKPNIVDAVKKFRDKSIQFMFTDAQQLNEYSVFCHGDCWSTNLLFKYEDQNTPEIPTKLMIIDWQMALMNSPIHDISYFLYISAEKKELENYMRYLHIYHAALSDTLMAFGLDPDDVYPFELFEQQWKENSKIGFFMTLLMMQQTLSDGKLHDFEQMAEEGKDIIESFNDRKNNISDLFKQRMGDLVEFLVEHNFI